LINVTIEKEINAPADTIWNTISDFTIPAAPSFSVNVVKNGDSENNGVGTLRNVTVRKNRFLEHLADVDPSNRTLVYEILSNIAFKKYTGTIAIIPQSDISQIKWTANFTPRIFGTGWLMKKPVRRTINYIIDEINKAFTSQ
jgi:hypothetical protein